MPTVEIIIVALLGSLAAVLANKNLAVFNDGLRPIIPQYLEGKIDRKILGTTAFALGFGLVIGYGIPVSIGASIILVHSIFLATDIIGTALPDGKKGLILSIIFGALLGVGLVFGLEIVIKTFELLPYNFLTKMDNLGKPIVVGFAAFPALAIAYQHGFKKGFMVFLLQLLILVLVKKFGIVKFNNLTIRLSAEGLALIGGMIFLLFYAMQVKGTSDANQKLVSVFFDKVQRIKKSQLILAIMGGLVASATALGLIAGDPVSQNLMSANQYGEAGFAALARGIGFIPLVFSTAIVSGVYGPAGTTFVFAIGLFLKGNPLVAFIAGFLLMLIEVNLISSAAKAMDRYPGVREMGENIRTSMNKILETALLIGGAVASEAMAPGIGYFYVIGFWWLNETLKKPLVKLAVGPIAAISLGIILNILKILSLWTPPV